MIVVTSNAAGSIARRNALLGGAIPRAYVQQLAEFAKRHAVGEAKDLPARLQRAFAYFVGTLGVPLEKVLAYLEKPSMEDCTLAELDELQGLKTALKEGHTTVQAAFADEEAPVAGGTKPDLTAAPTAGTKRTRKAPPAPKTAEPAPTPNPTEPEPAQGPEALTGEELDPKVAHEDNCKLVAERLHAAGVDVNDFFDWCKGSGRDQRYKFAPDDCESLLDLPPQLAFDLLAKNGADLAICIKMFKK